LVPARAFAPRARHPGAQVIAPRCNLSRHREYQSQDAAMAAHVPQGH